MLQAVMEESANSRIANRLPTHVDDEVELPLVAVDIATECSESLSFGSDKMTHATVLTALIGCCGREAASRRIAERSARPVEAEEVTLT